MNQLADFCPLFLLSLFTIALTLSTQHPSQAFWTTIVYWTLFQRSLSGFFICGISPDTHRHHPLPISSTESLSFVSVIPTLAQNYRQTQSNITHQSFNMRPTIASFSSVVLLPTFSTVLGQQQLTPTSPGEFLHFMDPQLMISDR